MQFRQKFGFSHFFSPFYSGCLTTRREFEPRYSGTRQPIFERKITTTRARGGLSPGSNPHPNPDDHQGYDDHRQVNREPSWYAFVASLRHGASLRAPHPLPEERKRL
jgi:hypothetical protein